MLKFSKKLPRVILTELRTVYLKKSPEGGKYRFTYSLKSEHSEIFYFTGFLIIALIFFLIDQTKHDYRYLYTFAFILFIYCSLLIVEIFKDYFIILGGFVYVDQYYFLKFNTEYIEYFPIVKFDKYEQTIIKNNLNELNIYSSDDRISIRFRDSQNNDALEFISRFQTFYNYSIQRIKSYQSYYSNSEYSNRYSRFSILKYLKKRKNFLLSSIILAFLFFYAFPYYVDANAFGKAKKTGTASAYREYLNDNNNSLYINDAIQEIRNIYNQKIDEYRNYATSEGAMFFILLLEYLRDNDLYSVPLFFKGENNITILSESYDYSNLISPIESFAEERLTVLENDIRNAIKKILGRIFPADILNITSYLEKNESNPVFLINYSYENMPTFYYPVKEDYLPFEKRTLYYGIQISWVIEVYLPQNSEEPIYEFSLISIPAPEFKSQTESRHIVYRSMIKSAFYDLEAEFKKQFFE
jgi:hypothetical protein